MTRSMPNVHVSRFYGIHKGGTKDYTITEVKGPNGTVLFNAFGKVGTNAQADIMLVQGTKDLRWKLNDREKGGYDMRRQDEAATSFDDLGRFLTQKQLKSVELRHLRWLWKEAELDDINGAGGNMVAERNKLREEMERQAAEQKRIQEAAEAARMDDEMKNNPMWGAF